MTNTSDATGWQSLSELTARIISAYLEKHGDVAVGQLPKLVADVRAALGPNGQVPRLERATVPRHDVIARKPPQGRETVNQETERLLAEESERNWPSEQDPWVEEVTPPVRIATPPPKPQEPAVPIDKALHPDHIICLECGSHHKSMKGHLRSKHGLMPAEYREKWGLEKKYPMVPPSYTEKRRQIASQIGLGRKIGRK